MTTIPPAVAFRRAADLFGTTLARVDPAAWDAPTPCHGWTVRDVVGHVLGTLDRAVAAVDDVPFVRPDESTPPGHRAGADPLRTLRTAAASACDAVRAAGPGRDLTAALTFPTTDLVVHAWDVARGAGVDVTVPGDLLALVVRTAQGVPEEILRSPGRFGPARRVPVGADDTTRVMAWLGRSAA